MPATARATPPSISVGTTMPTAVTPCFNQLPGVAEKPPVQNVPAAATAQDGAHAYVTQSNHGTWLYGSSHGGDGTQG